MAAMAPVASTSNPVAPRALPSWGSRRLARACDGRGGLHLAPFATSVPSRRASSSVTSREAIAVGDEEAGGAPRDNTSDIIAAKFVDVRNVFPLVRRQLKQEQFDACVSSLEQKGTLYSTGDDHVYGFICD